MVMDSNGRQKINAIATAQKRKCLDKSIWAMISNGFAWQGVTMECVSTEGKYDATGRQRTVKRVKRGDSPQSSQKNQMLCSLHCTLLPVPLPSCRQ